MVRDGHAAILCPPTVDVKTFGDGRFSISGARGACRHVPRLQAIWFFAKIDRLSALGTPARTVGKKVGTPCSV
jgi:hypothetical protein